MSNIGADSWGGTATSARTISVKVKSPANELLFEDSKRVDVTGRTGWKLPRLNTPATLPSTIPTGWGKRWGVHIWQAMTEPTVKPGTGPWAGEYIASGPPDIRNAIYLHPDFISGGPNYPRANTTCSGVSQSAGVRTVNDKCGTGANLDEWSRKVLEHEKRHEWSLGECFSSSTTATALTQIEALLSDDEKWVENKVDELWRGNPSTDLYTKFEKAAETPQGSIRSPVIWEHRDRGRWTKQQLRSAGHNGRWGC